MGRAELLSHGTDSCSETFILGIQLLTEVIPLQTKLVLLLYIMSCDRQHSSELLLHFFGPLSGNSLLLKGLVDVLHLILEVSKVRLIF